MKLWNVYAIQEQVTQRQQAIQTERSLDKGADIFVKSLGEGSCSRPQWEEQHVPPKGMV